jgi:hypothetical protein
MLLFEYSILQKSMQTNSNRENSVFIKKLTGEFQRDGSRFQINHGIHKTYVIPVYEICSLSISFEAAIRAPCGAPVSTVSLRNPLRNAD